MLPSQSMALPGGGVGVQGSTFGLQSTVGLSWKFIIFSGLPLKMYRASWGRESGNNDHG